MPVPVRNTPKNNNRPWRAVDLSRMRAHARKRLSARESAIALGRTTGAVKFKAMVEGIRFRAINQPPGVQKRLARRLRRQRR